VAKLARWLLIALWCCWLPAADTVQHPFRGVTYIERVETADLAAPGIAFKLSPPGGTLETVRQTTLEFLLQEHAQIAIDAHYFLPWPSSCRQQSGRLRDALSMPQKLWGRQSCLRTRFPARPGAGWKAGGSQDWLPHWRHEQPIPPAICRWW